MRNDELLESDLNKTFEEILFMNDDDFRQWVIDLRKLVVKLWDEKGLPPKVGYTKEETISQFRKMVSFPVHTLEIEKDIIRNTSKLGNAVSDWFPTMMKTKISYSKNGTPRSIYDYFSDPDLLETFITYADRHFRRDSFYHYSTTISSGEILKITNTPWKVTTPEDFVKWFDSWETHGYFLCPVSNKKVYSGYNTNLSKKKNLEVDASFQADSRALTNVKPKWKHYKIRIYKKGQKLFPLGLKAFRVSFCQYAVNFPPLTARYLYERFTNHIKEQERINIYDPSSGWGGRLLGAMSSSISRNIHYIGNDPNTDHNVGDGRTKYHEIADFFNKYVRESGTLYTKSHSYEVFQEGSEVIHLNPDFQKYKGKLDLVFTSPPYFSKEVYSADPEQSCHKFDNYAAWRDEFLEPTLRTAVEYLRGDRYLLWNISDIVLSGEMLPLEEDSHAILKSLGMEYITTIKMVLAAMPGSNRFTETGETETISRNTVFGEINEEKKLYSGKMKNFIQIKSGNKEIFCKYEPILIYYKK